MTDGDPVPKVQSEVSATVIFGPQPAGLGNKHVYAVQYDISAGYTSGGIDISLPSSLTGAIAFASATGGYAASVEDSKLVVYSAPGTEISGSAECTVTVLYIGN